jgi:GH15 family glucan-1,4-alpha-glucosidase
MSSLPIGDYALLSDCRSAALVSRAGSVDWLCFPRFDAPAVFARILDQAGGHFSIWPAGAFQASRARSEAREFTRCSHGRYRAVIAQRHPVNMFTRNLSVGSE